MYWIAHRFVHDGKPWTLPELSSRLSIPDERVAELLTLLQERGLLLESSGDQPEYLLTHDPANLTIDSLMQLLRMSDEEQSLMEQRTCSVEAVDDLMQRVDLGIREQLQGMTLRDLVLDPLRFDSSEVA